MAAAKSAETSPKLDFSLLPSAGGYSNIAQCCWLNAAIQAIMRCTALTKALFDNETDLNPVAREYLDLLIGQSTPREVLAAIQGEHAPVIQSAWSSAGHSIWGTSDDAHQLITALIDAIDTGKEYFNTYFRRTRQCSACGHKVSSMFENNLISIPEGVNWSEYIRKGQPEQLTDVLCDVADGGCGQRGASTVSTTIAKLSSILIVYTRHVIPGDRPERIRVRRLTGDVISYRLVSSIEYPPGHYYTYGLSRSKATDSRPIWYRLDDSSVASVGDQPPPFTTTSIVSIYHLE